MVAMLADKAAWDKAHADAGEKLVVVDFTAAWCSPCQKIAPFFAELADKYDDVVFVKVDVDENNDVAELCEVSAMPTFQCFKGGNKVAALVGAAPEALEDLVTKNK